jgi:hypothetical protein
LAPQGPIDAEETDGPAARLARPPLLAALASLAAFADLAWNRIGLRLVDPSHRDLWIPLVRHGRLLRNLAGISGLVAALTATFVFLRMAGFARLSWHGILLRLSVAGVAGLYLPGIALALVAPRERVPNLVLVLGLVSANALVALLAVGSLSYRRVGPAWPSLMAGLTALLAMIGLLVASTRTLWGSTPLAVLGVIARHGGELAWTLAPATLLLDPETRQRARDHRRETTLAVLAALLVAGLGVWAQAHHGSASARLVYGAFRLAALPADATFLYAIPVGIGVGLALLHLLTGDRRQLGWGLLLWIAAGLAPRTPIGTLYEVLAGLLLARAAQAAHPEGRARATEPWGRPTFDPEA